MEDSLAANRAKAPDVFAASDRSTGIVIRQFDSATEASRTVAGWIASLIRERQLSGSECVLGLATGATPIPVYAELVRMHREDGLSFENVVSFNLDEYFPIFPDDKQSYVHFMNEHLFDHVDIDPGNVHVPDGTIAIEEVEAYCDQYEKLIEETGGIDMQLLGIGRTGHIGFNEPGSGPDSRTRMVSLDPITLADAACQFGGLENVPRQAITMGVGTIMRAKKIFLLASGIAKAPIVARALSGSIDSSIPATFLRNHPHVEFVLDEDAASRLP